MSADSYEKGDKALRPRANGLMKVTKEQVMQAIRGSAGIKIVVADRLKLTRQGLENYFKRFPDLVEMLVQEREQALDMAELLVLTNIQIQRAKQNATGEVVDSSDAWKLLDKIGYKRGYSPAGNLNGAMDMAREAAGAGQKVTIREVVVELPKDDSLYVEQPILGEPIDIASEDVDAEEDE